MNELFPLADGKGEATSAHLMSQQASTGQQLCWLLWSCAYQQAGCFESMFLAPSPEDAEESFGTSKYSFRTIIRGENRAGHWEQRLPASHCFSDEQIFKEYLSRSVGFSTTTLLLFVFFLLFGFWAVHRGK